MDAFGLFLIGLLGSLHCIGMCGPILLALPVKESHDLMNKILYNLGRITTYSLLGLGTGYIGNRFFAAGLQQDISIVSGAIVIIYVLLPFSIKAKIGSLGIVSIVYRPVKRKMGNLFRQKNILSNYAIGLLNGLLPCGFVYAALPATILLGSPLSGAAGMALFGLGTIPLMLSFSLSGKFIGKEFRRRIKKLTPVLVCLLGLLFILRGLNLGIPFVSPKIQGDIHSAVQTDCCN